MSEIAFIRLQPKETDAETEAWVRLDRIDVIVSDDEACRVYLGRDYFVDTIDKPESILEKMDRALNYNYSDDLDSELGGLG